MHAGLARENTLRAGAAQVDITPEPGLALTGFILRLGPSTGVHDRLYARALALEVRGCAALLVSCDLLALDAAFSASARSAIHAATGIPETHILIACTHTHSGPATVFLRDCGEVDPAYLDGLGQKLVEAARGAAAALQPARVGYGRGELARGVKNRRTGGAPVDPELSVLGFQGENGELLAVLVNYACHAVCLDHTNRLVSADYPGYLARTVQERTGAAALFFNGACGDINPRGRGAFSVAEELGGALAGAALRVLGHMDFRDTSILRVSRAILDLPLNPAPDLDGLDAYQRDILTGLRQAQEDGNADGAKIAGAFLGWVEDIRSRMLLGDLPASQPAEIQAVRVGDFALAGVPGELFSEVGARIKRAAGRPLLLAGYANHDIGYIPTRQAYALGGYEIDEAYKYYGAPAALAPEAGELIQTAVMGLLEANFKSNLC